LSVQTRNAGLFQAESYTPPAYRGLARGPPWQVASSPTRLIRRWNKVDQKHDQQGIQGNDDIDNNKSIT
jgi:hypothetical protein